MILIVYYSIIIFISTLYLHCPRLSEQNVELFKSLVVGRQLPVFVSIKTGLYGFI